MVKKKKIIKNMGIRDFKRLHLVVDTIKLDDLHNDEVINRKDIISKCGASNMEYQFYIGQLNWMKQGMNSCTFINFQDY
jgi:hypothetical protein